MTLSAYSWHFFKVKKKLFIHNNIFRVSESWSQWLPSLFWEYGNVRWEYVHHAHTFTPRGNLAEPICLLGGVRKPENPEENSCRDGVNMLSSTDCNLSSGSNASHCTILPYHYPKTPLGLNDIMFYHYSWHHMGWNDVSYLRQDPNIRWIFSVTMYKLAVFDPWHKWPICP